MNLRRDNYDEVENVPRVAKVGVRMRIHGLDPVAGRVLLFPKPHSGYFEDKLKLQWLNSSDSEGLRFVKKPGGERGDRTNSPTHPKRDCKAYLSFLRNGVPPAALRDGFVIVVDALVVRHGHDDAVHHNDHKNCPVEPLVGDGTHRKLSKAIFQWDVSEQQWRELKSIRQSIEANERRSGREDQW